MQALPGPPRPVVLVHGTFGNSVDNWLVLAPYLVKRGYCVFSLDYGQLPGVPFFHGLGPVEESAAQLDAFVARVRGATGAAEVDIVGHSQGGMMPRHYLKFLGGAAEVNALVGIAPSNHGTTLGGLTRLLPYFPGVAGLIDEHTPPSPTRSRDPPSSPGSTRAATPSPACATRSSPPAGTRSSRPGARSTSAGRTSGTCCSRTCVRSTSPSTWPSAPST
ncbi:alpha/beta fold hydrolase [Streptomyces zhihengii]